MAMLNTDGIQWHEGMLLLPQHFQQNDLRQRELLYFHISQLTSFHWGAVHVSIDPVKLVDGTLYIDIVEAVMPDGLVISSYASEGEIIEADLSPFAEKIASEPQLVYLAVPTYQISAANATGTNARFASRESKTVVDENTGEGELKIPRLAPNAQLFIAETPPSNYISFPLFSITSEANAFKLHNFIAPCLKVHKNSSLGDMCEQVITKIRGKIAYLSERLLSSSKSHIAGDTEAFSRALTTGLLPFEALLNAGGAHPFNLYVALCGLAGQIAGLLPAQIPPLFKTYDHDDLRSSYSEVITFIEKMLDRIQEGYIVFPFSLEDRTFSRDLKPSWLDGKFILGAKASPTMSRSELVTWIEESVIASESYIPTAMDNRILGARRRIIIEAENIQLVPPQGVVLFEVDVDDRYIKSDEAIQVINVSDEPEQRPVEIVIYVPKQRL